MEKDMRKHHRDGGVLSRTIKNGAGFTLIELMIVIAIIGILAALGMTNYITSQKRARDAKRMAGLEEIRSALEMCRADMGSYPSGSGNCPGSFTCDSSSYTLPTVDPCSYTRTGEQSYTLCTIFEMSPTMTWECVYNP